MEIVSLTVEQLDRRALSLLLSVVVYMVLAATLENYPLGSLILIASLYAILITSILQFAAHERSKAWLLPSIFLAGASMAFIVLAHVMPTRPFVAANQGLLIAFFTLVVAGLFKALGCPGTVTKGRLYTSASLYLILAMLWAAVYRLIEIFHPGSFLLAGASGGSFIPRSYILYMSLVSLTTLGTADLVPASTLTRMLVGMESVTGVLYVAVTIARLVSAYQVSHDQRS